jgi:hypothetical protein
MLTTLGELPSPPTRASACACTCCGAGPSTATAQGRAASSCSGGAAPPAASSTQAQAGWPSEPDDADRGNSGAAAAVADGQRPRPGCCAAPTPPTAGPGGRAAPRAQGDPAGRGRPAHDAFGRNRLAPTTLPRRRRWPKARRCRRSSTRGAGTTPTAAAPGRWRGKSRCARTAACAAPCGRQAGSGSWGDGGPAYDALGADCSAAAAVARRISTSCRWPGWSQHRTVGRR